MRRARLELLAESAGQPGFVRAAARFVDELGRASVAPADLTRALRAWAGDGPRRRYAEEVAAIYRGYRAGLEAAGLADRRAVCPARARRARPRPRRLGHDARCTVYGFDDFDRLQLDALELLANRCGVDVVASLPYEPGRRRVQDGRDHPSGAARERRARARAAARSTTTTRRIARGAAPRGAQPVRGRRAAPRRAGRAIRFHSAGGRRAEIELAARACSTCCGRAWSRATWRSCCAARASTRRCSSRSSAPTTSRSRSTGRCGSATPGWAPGCSR